MFSRLTLLLNSVPEHLIVLYFVWRKTFVEIVYHLGYGEDRFGLQGVPIRLAFSATFNNNCDMLLHEPPKKVIPVCICITTFTGKLTLVPDVVVAGMKHSVTRKVHAIFEDTSHGKDSTRIRKIGFRCCSES